MRVASSSAAPPLRDSERRRLRRVTRGACLALEAAAGTSHHGRAPKKRGLSPAQCPSKAWADHNQRGTARARSKLECCASSLETASAGARATRDTRRWLGVGGRSWHVAPRARAEGERPLAGAVPFDRHGPTTTSAARRARAASSSAAPPPERQRAQARLRCATRGAGLALEAAAGTSHHGRAPKERGLSPVQCLYVAMTDHNQRGTARARSKLECCASSPETASAGAPALVTRGAGLALEAAAGTSHHGRAPKERGLSPAQCPF